MIQEIIKNFKIKDFQQVIHVQNQLKETDHLSILTRAKQVKVKLYNFHQPQSHLKDLKRLKRIIFNRHLVNFLDRKKSKSEVIHANRAF